ncbi:hypothetical protein RCC89_20700 [Cytophagaceae bacterium ABcell3]|nr:hypothetical protein RCC89_20700 [Cytophagaceae bacterium ABcell3]
MAINVLQKEKLQVVVDKVKNSSFEEKRNIFSQVQVDYFLDKILELKKVLSHKADKLNNLSKEYDELIWFTNPSEGELRLLNELVASSKDLRSSVIKTYILLNNTLGKRGLQKKK